MQLAKNLLYIYFNGKSNFIILNKSIFICINIYLKKLVYLCISYSIFDLYGSYFNLENDINRF